MDDNVEIGRIGSAFFNFEIADTPAELYTGLSGRIDIPETNGMLFVFAPGEKNTCIVMRNMKFNIDVLWFDAQKRLIHQKRDLSPKTYPEQFCSPTDAAYVVELAAGSIERNQIKPGDKLDIEL